MTISDCAALYVILYVAEVAEVVLVVSVSAASVAVTAPTVSVALAGKDPEHAKPAGGSQSYELVPASSTNLVPSHAKYTSPGVDVPVNAKLPVWG